MSEPQWVKGPPTRAGRFWAVIVQAGMPYRTRKIAAIVVQKMDSRRANLLGWPDTMPVSWIVYHFPLTPPEPPEERSDG